jgi:drug/metabolite transporter (DMT)-like permease
MPSHPALRTAALTVLAMLAFAGNSLLCRIALRDTAIDAASFTSLRLASGALALAALLLWRYRRQRPGQPLRPLPGHWLSAAALFVYAAGFSSPTSACRRPPARCCCSERCRRQ